MQTESQKQAEKKWREKNKEKVRELKRQWYQKRKEAGLLPDRAEYFKKWQRENRDKVNAASKRWREKDLEKFRTYNREAQRKRRQDPAERKKDQERAKAYYHSKGKYALCRTPAERFRSKLLQKYGLTLERYHELLEACNGKCPICRETFVNRGSHVVVDHCHSTGFVRGLLCEKCNQAEGSIKTPENALRLYEYMKKNEIFYKNGDSSPL